MFIGSLRKQRAVSKTIIDDNLSVELTPFSFALSGGDDELSGAPHALILSLKQKVVQLLEEIKCKDGDAARLTLKQSIIHYT